MACTTETLKIMFDHLATVMNEHKQYLIELDTAMGDADLGLTMSKIFSEASTQLKIVDESDVGKLLFKAGMIMANAAPSTMGTLMASGFMEVGKTLKGKTNMDIQDWVLFAQSFKEGIAKRGKAEVGQKTILDVLDPVAKALEAEQFTTVGDVLKKAEEVAKVSLEDTKKLQAQHGRGAYYGEKSIGHQDAGATVAQLMYQGMRESIS